MAVAAWHTVNLFRLSLGMQDQLQEAVRRIRESSSLAPSAPPTAIRKHLGPSSSDCRHLQFLHRYVPTRFLSPWFAEELRGVRDTP
jgi:hypothetical protein